MHRLIFTMQLQAATQLLLGNLQLIYPDGVKIDYLATSGCIQWQQPEDQWAVGRGPIPEGDYQIPTIPYWLNTRGIEGWFFHIQPDRVSPSGILRSEFGIHFDANVPGTAGCIGVIREFGWRRFCDRMASIAKLGLKSLPLTVKY